MAASRSTAKGGGENNNFKRQVENYKIMLEREPLVQGPKHLNFNSNLKWKFLSFSKESILFFRLVT